MNPENNSWVFRLFVSGKKSATDLAVAVLEEICEKHLEGLCDIKVIDVLQDPLSSMQENILATPTLLKKYPEPARRLIGDLSDKGKVLKGLSLTN